MHLRLITSCLIALASAATITSKCNADNCLRQVRASAFPSRATSSDCSTYQTTYLTAATTVTVSNGPTTPGPTNPAIRTIPSYASGCGAEAAYRSACSCNSQPSTVITVTPTVVAPAASCTALVIQAIDGTYASAYLSVDDDGIIRLNSDLTSTPTFEYRERKLYQAGSSTVLLNANTNGDESLVYLDSNYFADGSIAPTPADIRPLLCDISTATEELTCVAGSTGGSIFLTDSGESTLLFIGKAIRPGFTKVTLRAISVCK